MNGTLLRHGSGTVLRFSAWIVAAASLCIASAVSSEPFGYKYVSFVNVDSVEIDLVVTDKVSGGIGTKNFHLKTGITTGDFKISGDPNNGGNSNFTWKATGQDASGKKVSRCNTEKQPIRGGSYGRIDVSAGVGNQKYGSSC